MDREASELLTVIIPFLNEGPEVKNTLRSIREHGGERVAVLLINDASNDGYPYEEYAEEYRASYFFNSERQGVARSRDMGIEMCRTPYFLLLDAHMRFYQEDWIQILVGELEKDERVLLCCNTRILRKNEQGEMYDAPGENKTFGARVHFERDSDMLGAKWVATERKPGEDIEDVGCVLGAGYAASKKYWQYLKGLEGLIFYGSDEGYISLKVWMEGGRCRLLKNLYIGHYYRPKAPYRIASSFVLYNKLLIAYLLLPLYMQVRAYAALQQEYTPKLFKAEFGHLMEKKEEWEELKKYYQQIFTRSFEEVWVLNQKQEKNLPDNAVLLDKVFREVLLNCNRTDELGIEKGRMGSILFLAAYTHKRKDEKGEELVGTLVDQFYERMDMALPFSWSEGLYGIAYGMTWLIANGFMEGDVSEVLSEIDARIMERNPQRIKDYGWGHGLAGLLYYVLYRLKYWQEQGKEQPAPFDPEYLQALEEVARKVLVDEEQIACREMPLFYLAFREGREVHWEMVPEVCRLVNFGSLNFPEQVEQDCYGLKKGWAGLGMRLLEKEKALARKD